MTIYDDNQCICHCKYKTVVSLGSFRILLPFFDTSWSVGILNSAIFNSFHNWVVFGKILGGLLDFGGGLNHPPPPPPPRYATDTRNSA
jgi:hypothetical protein